MIEKIFLLNLKKYKNQVRLCLSLKIVFREVFILAKITIDKCEILENDTLEINIEKIIYSVIIEEIKNRKCIERKKEA